MYKIIGWINVASVVLIFLGIILQNLNSSYFKKKDGWFVKTIDLLRKFHKPLGGILLLLAIYHGILALGSLQLHTGTLLGGMVIITAIFGIVFQFVKRVQLFKLHKILASILLLAMLIHLIFPSILYFI